jgi:hypothetical protein
MHIIRENIILETFKNKYVESFLLRTQDLYG